VRRLTGFFLLHEGHVNKGVLVVLMAGVGIGMALSKMLAQAVVQEKPATVPAIVPASGHKLADRLRGFLEVERN
jgi:hypothetical protein